MITMLFLAFLLNFAFADNIPPQCAQFEKGSDKYRDCVTMMGISQMNDLGPSYKPYCPDCAAAAASTNPNNDRCQADQKRLVADGEINITLAAGYKDNTPFDFVSSQDFLDRTLDMLLTPCEENPVHELWGVNHRNFDGATNISASQMEIERKSCGQKHFIKQACGFSQTDDPEFFQKTITNADGKRVSVKIRVLNAALTDSNVANNQTRIEFVKKYICTADKVGCFDHFINKRNASLEEFRPYCKKIANSQNVYQPCRSLYVQDNFLQSISSGDEAVFAFGHARRGGGESFEPPVLNSEGYTDYSWYSSAKGNNRQNHKQVAQAFRNAQKPPVVYGSLTCNSKKHFETNGEFPEVSPQTKFVLSNRTSFDDEMRAAFLSSVDSLLGNQCGPQINQSIERASCAFSYRNF